MITDKIVWPKNYETENADIHVGYSVKVNNLTAEQLWPYAINIADWNRYCDGIVSAEFVNPDIQDPHLFKKAEFTLHTDRYTAIAIVLSAVEPKEDRPGRLAIEMEVYPTDNPDATMTLVHEFLLSVEHDGTTAVTSEINAIGALAHKNAASAKDLLKGLNVQWVNGLIKFTAAHSGVTYQEQKEEIKALHGWT